MLGESSTFTNDWQHLRLQAALHESDFLRELAELVASSLDLNHILQLLVKRTAEVCGVERCAVWLLDDVLNVFRPATYYLSPQVQTAEDTHHISSKSIQAAEHLWFHTPVPLDDPFVQRLLNAKTTLILNDMSTDPRMRPAAEHFLIRSVLLVPLIRERRPVGMMSLDDPDKIRTFSAEQQHLAQAIGQLAAIAVDNARLYQQAQMERKRAEQLIERAQAVNQVALAVNAGEDLTAVLKIALQHLVHGLKADGGAIMLLDTNMLHLASTTQLQQHRPSIPMSIALTDLPNYSHAAMTGVPLFVAAEQAKGNELVWHRELGLDNAMLVPLMIGQNRCVGLAFVNYRQPNYRPSKGQFAFAQDIAAQCALAVDKAHILADARQAAALAIERANILDAVFHAMTEGINVLTQDGQELLRNNAASAFLGENQYTKDGLAEILKHRPAYTMSGQLLSVEDFPITRALRGELIRGEQLLIKPPNSNELIVETNIAPLFDATKTQIGIVSAFRDITEQMRIEQRIRQALDIMLHVAIAVSGITEIKDILHSVLEMVLTTFNCERGSVHLYDAEQDIFSPLLCSGFSAEAEKQWLTQQNQWLTAFDSHRQQGSQYNSLETQLIAGQASIITTEQYPQLLSLFKQTSVLLAPISNAHRMLGLMMVDCSVTPQHDSANPVREDLQRPLLRAFTIWDMAVIEAVAQLAGLAIEQTRWQQVAMDARTNEAAMREANTLKDEFLAITAHEFRTPLTIILTNTQVALRALRRKSTQLIEASPQQGSAIREALLQLGENLSTIEEQTHQLTNIVNTFLEVTQINRGQLKLKSTETDLSEIANQVVTNYSNTSASHQLSCVILPHKHPYLVMGDRARLLQVFTNLVQNAIKYSPLGGPITVCLCQHMNSEGKATIEVSVEDKGIGVPKNAQPRLFERFYRASNTEGNKTRGIGLGLYVVAELLRMHNGTIRVESSGIPGEGSRFTFTLPTLPAPHSATIA